MMGGSAVSKVVHKMDENRRRGFGSGGANGFVNSTTQNGVECVKELCIAEGVEF